MAGHSGSATSLLTLIFGYTTIVNIIDRPEGLKIATIFIIGIVLSSLVSRVLRSTELRVQAVEADDLARRFLADATGGPVRIIANRPDTGLPEEYEHKLKEAMESHHLTPTTRCCSSRSGPATSRSSAACCRSLAQPSIATACCAA